jgi:23S rRNA (uracil1939-C5)-methyltransferase
MIELQITALSHSGEGIGRHEGRAIFVPFALPGETVRVEIIEEKKRFARARLLEIPAPAPDRIVPRCRHHFTLQPLPGFNSNTLATACGGCQLQHLGYPAQLAFKERTVRDQFQRLGGFADVPLRPALPSPREFNYRNHVQFALTPEGQLGFKAAGSHHVVAIRECHQVEPALADLFPRIAVEPDRSLTATVPELERVTLRAGTDGETLVLFETEAEAPEVALDLPVSAALLRPDGTTMTLAGGDHVIMEVHGRPFRATGGSFFQVNTTVAELLVDLVLDGLALTGAERVLDLYSGVGLFSAFLAPRARQVIGIEAYEPAVADAAVNLDEFDNVEIYAAPVEDVLPQLAGPFDSAVLDPPRAGCEPAALAALLSARLARIVYVSCDAATLARDARRLVDGGMALDWVQPVDMFPQTYHVECVAHFSAGAGEGNVG